MRPIIKFLIILLIGFFALFAYLFGVHGRDGRRSPSWPATEGTVVTSTVERETGYSESGLAGYRVYVKYAYVVDGAEYTSSQVQFTTPRSYTEQQDAQRDAARYPVGGTVRVYYRPGNPSVACLEPGGESVWVTAGAVVMMVAMIGLCVFGFVEYSRHGPCKL